MCNFKIDVELVGAAREEYEVLDVEMKARSFKTVYSEGKALTTGEYRYSCFAGQLNREMVEREVRKIVERVAKELRRACFHWYLQ